MIDLSIVIVSWNTRDLLRECLESVYRHTKGITFEIFVVDNDSSDGSAEMVHELFPEVTLIENKENAGFSKANNQAIRISRGRYVALLNPDTLLIEDVFSPLIRYADQHEKIGAIGPKIFCRDGKTIQNECARMLPNLYFEFCRLSGLSRKFRRTRIFGGETMSYWDHNSSIYAEALSGACMVVKKKAINDIGLMDENQFMYADDIDWCKRVIDAGWDIYYYADASIIHYGGESAKKSVLFTTSVVKKSTWYYYKKHKGKIYAFAYCVFLCIISMLKYNWYMLFRKKTIEVVKIMETYKNHFIWSLQKIIGKNNEFH